MSYISAEGSSSAKLMIVGDMPTPEDERNNRAFSGSAGRMVREFLTKAGMPHNHAYYTYVCKDRSKIRDIKDFEGIDYEQLKKEINHLKPNCILTLGNVPLKKLTGNTGVEMFRGSILPCVWSGCSKVVSSVHPFSLYMQDTDGKMREWKDATFIQWDFERAVTQSGFPNYDPPRRNLVIARNDHDLYSFLRRFEGRRFVSVDIETFKTFPLCISFAFSRHEAISVPLLLLESHGSLGITKSQLTEIWKMVVDLMANPEIYKIGQNFKFDEGQLTECYNRTINFGIETRGFYFDTHLAFRPLFPELPASLQFIASVLTEEPYYKEEGKGFNPKKDKLDRLLLYNAKDAAVTYECYERILEEMQSIKINSEGRTLDSFFFEYVMPRHPQYMRIERRGILRSEEACVELRKKYESIQKSLQYELDGLTAEYLPKPINVASVGPSGDVPKLIFGAMKLPARKGTDEKTLDALMRNTVKDEKKKRILELILEIRKVRKTIGTYIEAESDNRGRLLTGYRLTLETGRTSTSILKPPVTTKKMGLAFQTITKHGEVGTDLRSQFIVDPGYIFFESDLSQAEARVVALLARDEKLMKMFQYAVDVHRVTTGWISNNCPDSLLDQFFAETDPEKIIKLKNEINKILKGLIDDEARQMGKKFRHAGHYDMKKREASQQAGVSEWRAGKILEQFHETNPKIRKVFHKEIQDALENNNRVLINPNGRRRQFLNKWGDELFKEAYADIPQGTVSDHLKQASFNIEKRLPKFQVVQEAHDSFLGLCPLDIGSQYPMKYLDKLVEITKEEMERPIDFKHCTLSRGELIIPCDMSIGEKTWLEMKKI